MFLNLITFFLAATISLQAANWEKYKQESLKKHHKIKGWCKREKAEKLMDFIHDTHAEVCVEIGVFGGSSTYPIAKALKYEKKGIVHAIDSWEKEESLKFETDAANINCWSSWDYEKIYNKFLKMLNKNNLTSYCNVMRTTGEKALATFEDESIDFIHVDGNHNEASCIKDAQMSLKKLKPGGYLLFDDANWHQTQKAVSYLKENCEYIPKYSVSDECLLFRKTNQKGNRL